MKKYKKNINFIINTRLSMLRAISIGTLKEIETATGKSRSWLRYMLFPRYSRRLDSRLCKGKNALRLVVLTEDEE